MMALASADTFKHWTREDWDKAIKDMQAQPLFWHGLDMSIKGDDKTCLTFSIPHTFKKGDKITFGNKQYTVTNVITSNALEIDFFKRKSKGYRKHIRRTKSKCH